MGYQVDATDRKIVALLLANGRTPSLEIARQIGVVEGTVRKRLERLLAEGVLKVSAEVDFEALGYGTHTLFHVQADLARIDEIGRQLAGRPEVVAVWQSTGSSDLMVEAVFASDRDLVSFLRDKLGRIPGLGRVETTHLVRALKRPSQWGFSEAPPQRERQLGPRASILVVDDDPVFYESIRAVLESQGYRVAGARSGDEGLAAMRRSRPDLVILDIMMADLLDGLRVSWVMGEDEALRDVPILMVSALPSTENAAALPADEHLRANEFLTKPVAPSTLLASVERLLAGKAVNQPT